VPKVWLSFSKSKVLAQEQKAYDQKVSAFIECLKGYRSRLRKVHRDAKRRRMPVGIKSFCLLILPCQFTNTYLLS
jgi:hypothetical protein